MNRDELIKSINEKLAGKLIERGYNFNIEYQIREAIKDFFEKEDFASIEVDKNNHSNCCFIRYKKYHLFSLRYTKKKGDYHPNYFGSYCDYYFKDFVCGDQSKDFDLKHKMLEIEVKTIREKREQDRLFAEMTENYKKVVALFGDKTRSVLAYFDTHRYELERAIE